MAFLVEDGTGVAGANSFTTIQFFRDYFLDRGIAGTDIGTIPDASVQEILIRATDYIVKRFGTRFKGSRATSTQTLPFPRDGVLIDGDEEAEDAVPDKIQQATVEYALRANNMTLAPDPPVPFDQTDASGNIISSGGVVQRKKEKVDVLEEDTTFSDVNSSYRRAGTRLAEGWMIPAYPAADLLLEAFLKSGGRVVR